MEFQDCSQWHHLIFCQEMENDDQNDVVCWLCKEPVLGCPAYKCLECNFLQHKSCIEPTRATKTEVKHNLRERHHLMFIEELDNGGKAEEVVCLGYSTPCNQSTPLLFECHQWIIIAMSAELFAVDPSSTNVSPAILILTSNVFPVGDLVMKNATSIHSCPCGSRCSSLVKLVLRKARVLPTYVAYAES
jgi:hypothetical protein